jgi:hypothetical protein
MTKQRRPKRATEEKIKVNPRVKEVLILLAGGALLGAFFVFPGLPAAFASYLKPERRERYQKYTENWEDYNLKLLRQTLKRLKNQKIVKIVEENGVPVVRLTEKGRTKVLKYNLEEMALKKPEKWDETWRLIIYDIPEKKRSSVEAFRYILKKLKCLRLQKSVYLTPYPCKDEIEYLREVLGVGDEVALLAVSGIEDEVVYRKYFGL